MTTKTYSPDVHVTEFPDGFVTVEFVGFDWSFKCFSSIQSAFEWIQSKIAVVSATKYVSVDLNPVEVRLQPKFIHHKKEY